MIDALLQALGEVCQAEQFVPKRLVVKSYHDGHQLLKALARHNLAWLNATPVTPDDLTMEVAGKALIYKNIEAMAGGDILFLISQVLGEMRERGKLKYFADLESLEGPEGVLKDALLELRMAAVGWGRERYAACLEKLKQEIKEGLQKAEAAGRSTHYQSAKLDHFPKLEQLIATLLEEVPEENATGQDRLDQLCRGVEKIIEKYAHTAGDLDREARESILELLDQLARSKTEPVKYRLALKRLRKHLKALRVSAALAEPGYLHVAPAGRAEWLDRDYSFLVGLGGNYFPGSYPLCQPPGTKPLLDEPLPCY